MQFVPGDDTDLVIPSLSKRRRNTAASARFRMKKKEREQALEKHTRTFAVFIAASLG
jgi:hypothetical protein